MGVKERYEERQMKGEKTSHYGVRERSVAKEIEGVASSITNRLNTWLDNHNNYVSNYQSRYSDRKGNFEDSYVSDSADWLNTTRQQKSNFDAEADSILSYMDQYKDYLDPKWMESVRSTLTSARKDQSSILDSYTKDNEYWNSFNNEDLLKGYGSAEDAYKYFQRADGYNKKWTGKTSDELLSAVEGLEDGEEKDWLKSYASSVDYDEKSKYDIAGGRSEIDAMTKDLEVYKNVASFLQHYEAYPNSFDDQAVKNQQYVYNQLQSKYGSIDDLEKLISGKSSYVDEADKIQKLNVFSSVAGNADFADKSKYVSNVEYELLGKPYFTDDTYAYLNNPMVDDKRLFGGDKVSARSLINTQNDIYLADSPLRNMESSYEKNALDYITKDEVAIYNYYYETEGQEKANEYLNLLIDTLKTRKYAQAFEDAYNFGNEHPFWSSIASVGTSIGSGFEYIGDVIEYGGNKIFDSDAKMDTNQSALITNAIRGGVSDKVDWKIEAFGGWDAFDFVYNTAMSGIDSAASMAFGGAGSYVLGLSAAAQGTNDALQRGMNSDQAFWNGLASGIFEGLFEKLSIGEFNALKDSAIDIGLKGIDKTVIKTIAKNLGKTMLVNASEEALTEIANIAYDTLVNGEFANYTLEELKNGAWKDAALQVAEAAGSGALMGFGFGAVGNASAVNNGTMEKYGAHTGEMIQQGLENDTESKSYKLAQKFEKKTDKGKALTAPQIRKLLAANQSEITKADMKKIQQAAETRLTELGQTEDVSKVAELATKYATGQKLTREETSFLARSQYGSRVSNELLPTNIMSGDYSTEWAEGIGTKSVNALPYNIRNIIDRMTSGNDPATYKAVTERVGDDVQYTVAESGKTTFDGKTVSIAEVANIKDGKVTVKLEDGREVSAEDIEFANDDEATLYTMISAVENITPGDASALVKAYDPSSGMSVSEYVNGIDEAYTYGYHGYSEADMAAGNFAPKLSSQQAMSAYKLGQTTKNMSKTNKADAIKRMRTAVEAEVAKATAEGKEAPKAKAMTITYNHGGGKIESFNKDSIKSLSNKQKAAPVLAQVMHEMGLGTNFEFFSSYMSKDEKGNRVRVFLDDSGVEQIAYSGVYRKKDGTIRIDLNAYNGRKLTLDAMSHELTHFIQLWSTEKYEALADFLVKTYGEKTDMSMHDRVLREQARLKKIRKADVSYNEAFDEVVANAMSKMLADGKVMEKLNELKAQDATLAQKLWEGLKNLLDKFFRLYEKEGALFYDAADLMELKAEFEQMKQMWAEAFVEASENFQANLMAQEVGVEPVAVEDISQYSYSSLAEAAGFVAVENEDGTRSFTRDGKKVNKVTIADIDNSPIGAFINFSLEMGDISDADAKRQKQMFADICTMACQTNDFGMTMQFVGSAVFTGMKANADKQYGTTYDFPSICTKTQAVIDAMSAKMMALGRGLNTDEIVQLYSDVFASGNPVPCPECYVFSRWIGIGGLLDNIKKYQDYYGDMAVEDVADAYRKMKAEVAKFADEQGISFGKAKGALTAKLTKEYNKLREKVEKAQNQGEKVKPADKQRLAELEPMMNTVKSMTWLENVYFADSSLKKVNPKFRVPNNVLFDLNNGEAFASQYKDAWAFRTTQGAGYGKAITPYAEARLGEGVLVTNNTTNAIKGRAQGTLNNYFLQQNGKLDKQSRDALKRARLKQKIQAFIGGQRFQSTSDARYENASDYLLAALEMQAMHGMVQAYTKVDGAVPAFSAWGFSINQSLMPLNGGLDADGNVKDTAVGGMKPEVAFKNREKHESAGTITIGVNDNHIRAMFKQLVRDFIIPYHASGGKADVVAEFRRIQEGKEAKGKAVRSTDYSRTQSDKVLSDEVLRWQGKTDAQIQRIHEIRAARIAILTGGKVNMTVVRSNRFLSALYDKLNGGEWDGVKLAKSKVESQIFPNEFWDQTVTYDESAKITKDYLEYCEDLGFLHRFSGMIPSNGRLVPANGYNENGERVQLTDLAYKYDEKGNKTAEVEEFFWKVLTDRRMYDNSGNYLPQKIVTLNDTTTDTVTGFAKNNQGRQYDKAKAEALAKKIVGEQYSSQETDIDTSKDTAYDNAKKKTEQEGKANVTREEVSHRGDAESSRRVGKENSRGEGSSRESCERRIKEILREKVFGTNKTGASGRGRVETKETRADFESRVRNEGLMYVETGRNALAFKAATTQNENASIAASTLRKLGFDVIVFHGNLQHNGNEVTEICDAAAMVRSASDLLIFISSELDIDGMETAYHEAFHAARYGMLAKYHEKIADIIASNVDVESESFTQFIAKIANLYAYTENDVSASKFASEIIEEFYAWYVGKVYASESGDMQVDMAQFSDVETIKSHIDDVYAQMGANAGKAPPRLLEGQQFSTQETDADTVINSLYNQNTVSLDKAVVGWNLEHFKEQWEKGYYSSVIDTIAKQTGKSKQKVWNAFAGVLMKKEGIAKKDGKTYINVHELNEDNLRKALELGGLAAPSIGIVDVDNPVTHFGDIALIFPDVFSPETNPTYYGDSYSSSFPAVGSFTDSTMLQDALTDGFDGMEWGGILSKEEIYDLVDELDQVYFYDDSQRTSHSISRDGFANVKEFARNYNIKSIPGLRKLYDGLRDRYDSYEAFLADFAEKAFTNKRMHRTYTGSSDFDFDTRRYQFKDYSLDNVVDEMTATADKDFRMALGEKVTGTDELLSPGMRARLKYGSTNFYEVKPQRAVYFDEATYAVVPENTSADVIGMLEYAGVKVIKYQRKEGYNGIAEGRAEAIKALLESDTTGVRYSTQETDNISNRDLLANAFEGITMNSDEYKMIQEYKGHIAELNKLEAKLSDLNDEIYKMTFDKNTPRDSEKLKKLQSEAKAVAEEINKYDKRLVNLEASGPLRKVIEQERKKAAQKTKDHVKEIQENKKVRAEQTELRHKIRRAVRDLDKVLNRGNKKLNVKEDLQGVVSKALKAADILFTDNYGTYDMLRNGIGADLSDAEEALVESCTRMLKELDKMPTDGYDNFMARQEAENKLREKMSKLKEVFARERKRLNNTKVSSILGELADAYASLEKSTQSYVQGAYTEAVYNFLKNLQSEVGGTIVSDMTKDQLEYVYAAYKMVLTAVRKANQMFNEELKMSREQMGNAVIQEVINAGGVHGLWTKAEVAKSRADWNNTKPIWVANRIGSDTFGKLWQGLFQGQYNFAKDIEEAKKFKLDMDKKYKPRSWDAEKQYKFESSTGKEFSLSLQQIMSLYAYTKRGKQAIDHLLNGGFVFEGNSTVIVDEKGRKKTYIHNGATSYKMNEATINAIINSLTAEQKAYVDEMQKYLSEVMGAKGNEVSMQLYGIKMYKEQNYFPLRSSGAYMEKAKEAEMKKQQGQINLVNSGFTHAVKPEAKNPIILAGFLDVWSEHCNEMSMYHSMVLPMEDFRKVYNYSTIHDDKVDSASVYQTIQDAYGDAATAYIDQLYRELNAGATVDPRETPWKARISKFKKASVMLSASVVVQQFSSIGRAYAVIDPKYFIGAKVNSGTNLSVTEEMKKYAPVAIIKEMGGFDTGTKGNAKNYIMAETYGKGERLQGLVKDEQYRSDLMGYLPAKADEKTWCAIWEAAKRETKANNPKMDVKSDEFLKLAGDRFSEIVEKTQVYDSVLARSANMRSKGAFMAMATAFMAEPTTTINLIEDAVRSGSAKNIARTFGAVATSIVLNNALASIVYAMRDDDEDETFIEKYFQSFTSGMIDDINPMSYYPFLKDVYSLFQGYDVERADMSVIADVRDALKKAISVIGKDTSEMNDEQLAEHYKTVNSTIMSLLDAGCSMFGVPVKNVRRDAMGIINAWNTVGKDITERDTTWNSFWDKVGAAAKDTVPILAWTKDGSKTDKLYEAIVSGDNAYLGRLKSTYKTDASYQSAVRKALRENDPRIHEAAQAKYDGKSEEYKRIFRQIKNEGKFSFDDIMSAINSEENAIKNGLTPEKVTSSYTANGFVEAIITGNKSNAKAMREDIIASKVANGKTQEDAEKEFASSVATSTGEAYSAGLLDEAEAKNMLMEYAGKDEEEATSKVNYWAFCEDNPEYADAFTESHVAKYHEFAAPANISVAVYAQYINGTKGLTTIYDEWGDEEVSKREQVLEVIDSLPLTWEQKDALYLAAGYSESKIWDVPW